MSGDAIGWLREGTNARRWNWPSQEKAQQEAKEKPRERNGCVRPDRAPATRWRGDSKSIRGQRHGLYGVKYTQRGVDASAPARQGRRADGWAGYSERDRGRGFAWDPLGFSSHPPRGILSLPHVRPRDFREGVLKCVFEVPAAEADLRIVEAKSFVPPLDGGESICTEPLGALRRPRQRLGGAATNGMIKESVEGGRDQVPEGP